MASKPITTGLPAKRREPFNRQHIYHNRGPDQRASGSPSESGVDMKEGKKMEAEKVDLWETAMDLQSRFDRIAYKLDGIGALFFCASAEEGISLEPDQANGINYMLCDLSWEMQKIADEMMDAFRNARKGADHAEA